MMPPIVQWMNDSGEVVSLLKPLAVMRVFQDEIPQDQPKPQDGQPAVVYSLIFGQPANKLDCAPTIDFLRIQFDAYAADRRVCMSVFQAVRNVLEAHGYVSYNFTLRDEDTRDWRVSFDFTCWQPR